MKYLLIPILAVALAGCVEPSAATRAHVEQWKALAADDDAAMVPISETLVYPSAEEWEMISKRAEAQKPPDEKDE